MKNQLITGDDAIETDRQHTHPCADCPFARTALKGWLGSLTVEEWIEDVRGETRIDCHTMTAQCAGAAILRRNLCKLPRDKTLLVLPSDRARVFASLDEFGKHHSTHRIPS